MKKLGYDRFGAQGGDWGAVVTDLMGVQGPKELVGIHTNMPGAVPANITKILASNVLGAGDPPPSGLSAEEKRAFEQLSTFYKTGLAYSLEMGLRPQTLFGLADSPIGLAAWLLDHDAKSLDLIAKAFDGQPGGLTQDDVLDNITLFWLTNSGVSSSRLYWENKLDFFTVKGVKVPTAVSAFPDELYQAPRSWVEKAYPNLVYYNQPDVGGHFAAWEQPKLLSDDVRAGFRSMR
jgi:hypothetical protein